MVLEYIRHDWNEFHDQALSDLVVMEKKYNEFCCMTRTLYSIFDNLRTDGKSPSQLLKEAFRGINDRLNKSVRDFDGMSNRLPVISDETLHKAAVVFTDSVMDNGTERTFNSVVRYLM